MNETYLGDGVYATYDGYHIVLQTGGKEIFLDSHVQQSLIRFMEKIHGVKIEVHKDKTPATE